MLVFKFPIPPLWVATAICCALVPGQETCKHGRCLSYKVCGTTTGTAKPKTPVLLYMNDTLRVTNEQEPDVWWYRLRRRQSR
ncbi:uncharacterized protein B0T15DRAFT_537198 [Chaetomium strumarium]|uniref:Secreted protein n=1 Tax=Chaetomium strumarium TaxID=1170767 RepID=A0AAJ0GR79_9PEZI|nr:hypothetical protein B0T15DRAFT_537198 [Chaetomium strumarium]